MNDRVTELEQRVAELERLAGLGAAPGVGPSSGTVTYQGDVYLHGHVSWSIVYEAEALLGLDAARLADVLAALGNPIRLQIVRTLLRGPASAAGLQEAVGLSSPGQLYHHMKALTSARVVEQPARGDYRIAAEHVVPVLVSILAAADIAGELR